MSFRTQADEKLEATRDRVREAIESLACIVVAECPGTDDFNRPFKEIMRECLNNLMHVRQQLK